MNKEQNNTRETSRRAEGGQPRRTSGAGTSGRSVQGRRPAGTSHTSSRTDSVRSSANARKKNSHKRYGFIYFILVLLVLAVGAGLSFTVLFNTENIEVENAAVRYSDEAIVKASGIAAGDNMPRMNVRSIASSIEKKLPYIGKATIKRSFTNTVTISVEYTKAAVALETYAGYVVLDSSGKVLETGVQELADYVAEIFGAEVENAEVGEKIEFTDKDIFTYVTGLVSDFEKAGYKNLTMLDFSDLNNVTAEIDYRVTVKLGSVTRASSRLVFGKRVIDENLATSGSAHLVVDLTQDGQAFVRNEQNIEAASEALAAAQASAADETGEPLTADEPTAAEELTREEEESKAAGEEQTADEADNGASDEESGLPATESAEVLG